METPVDFLDSNFSFEMPLTFEEQTQISEEQYNLQLQLFDRMMLILKQNATEIQFKIVKLIQNDPYITQVEIAKEMGQVNQSSVVKSLRGNVSYMPDKTHGKRYGGTAKKWANLIINDEPCRKLAHQLHILDEPSLYLNLLRSFFPNLQDYLTWIQTPPTFNSSDPNTCLTIYNLRKDKKRYADIGKSFNISNKTIFNCLRRAQKYFNLPPLTKTSTKHTPLTTMERHTIYQLRLDGMSYPKIGKLFGYHRSEMHRIANEVAKELNQTLPHYKVIHTKLSSQERRTIYHLREDGMSLKDIAAMFDVSQYHVSEVVSTVAKQYNLPVLRFWSKKSFNNLGNS